MSMRDRFLGLDRRWIFLLVAVCILVPLMWPLGLPASQPTPMVKSIYDTIEGMEPNQVLLLSMDFDLGSRPELEPMAVAILRHAFEREIPVVGMTLWPAGAGLCNDIITNVADEYEDLVYGEDYAYLGYMVGAQAVVAQMSVNIYATYKEDYQKNRTEELPILKGRKTLKDMDYLISIAAGDPGVDTWVIYGEGLRKMSGGCTAVSVSQYLTYYQSGQINGLMGGLKGAAEYETALKNGHELDSGQKPTGTQKMEAQSVVHFLIIGLIIVCNFFYFTGRKKA